MNTRQMTPYQCGQSDYRTGKVEKHETFFASRDEYWQYVDGYRNGHDNKCGMNFAVGSDKISDNARNVVEMVNGSIEICSNPAISLVKLPEYAKIAYHDETANIIDLGGQMRLIQRIKWETVDCSLERWS